MNVEMMTYGMANAYLLHGDHAGILIDTGAGKYKDKILKHCENADVKIILLTHGHFDHCQSAAYLAKKLNCPVGIARADRLLLECGQKRKVYGKGIWGNFYAWASNRNIRQNEIEEVIPDIILEDGMSLREYGVDGKVIALPGHTKGSVGVILSSGELLVGDAMQNITFPSAAWCFEDLKQSRESAELIHNLNVKTIFYGHGRKTECNRSSD